MSFRQRASAQTHQTTMTIDLQGHKGACGASLDVEVEYTRTPDIPATGPTYFSGGEPACGGEVEIVEIRPFQYVRRLSSDPIHGNVKTYRDAPAWLLELIRDCIDTDLLDGED